MKSQIYRKRIVLDRTDCRLNTDRAARIATASDCQKYAIHRCGTHIDKSPDSILPRTIYKCDQKPNTEKPNTESVESSMSHTGLRRQPQVSTIYSQPPADTSWRRVKRAPQFKREKVTTVAGAYKPTLVRTKADSRVRVGIELSKSDAEMVMIAMRQLKTPDMIQYNRIMNKLTKVTKTSR